MRLIVRATMLLHQRMSGRDDMEMAEDADV